VDWKLAKLLLFKGWDQQHEVQQEIIIRANTGANISSLITWMMGQSAPSAALQMVRN